MSARAKTKTNLEPEIATLMKLVNKIEHDIANALSYVAAKRRLAAHTRTMLASLRHQQSEHTPDTWHAHGPPIASAESDRKRQHVVYDFDRIAAAIEAFLRNRAYASFEMAELIQAMAHDGVLTPEQLRAGTHTGSKLRGYLAERHLKPAGFVCSRGSHARWTYTVSARYTVANAVGPANADAG